MTKLVTFTDAKGPRVGAVLEDGRILDLSAAATGGALAGKTQDMLALIEAGPAALAAARALAAAPPPAAVLAAGSATLLAPVPRPRAQRLLRRPQLHGARLGRRARVRTRAQTSGGADPFLPKRRSGHCRAVVDVTPRRDASPKEYDYEAELAVVIGAALPATSPKPDALRPRLRLHHWKRRLGARLAARATANGSKARARHGPARSGPGS